MTGSFLCSKIISNSRYLMLLKLLSLALQFVNKFTLRSLNRNFNVIEVAFTRLAICEQSSHCARLIATLAS